MADVDEAIVDGDDPVHRFFDLSYAHYLTIPRSVLQSMPADWQHRFVACLTELEACIDWYPPAGQGYMVTLEMSGPDGTVRLVHDPLQDYERGRRRIPCRPRGNHHG